MKSPVFKMFIYMLILALVGALVSYGYLQIQKRKLSIIDKINKSGNKEIIKNLDILKKLTLDIDDHLLSGKITRKQYFYRIKCNFMVNKLS